MSTQPDRPENERYVYAKALVRAQLGARGHLEEIERMSRENATDDVDYLADLVELGAASSWSRPRRLLPWFAALSALSPTLNQPPSRWVLPVLEGERPADLTDEAIAEAIAVGEIRDSLRTPESRALLKRKWRRDDQALDQRWPHFVRETHRSVHAALTVDTAACEWCKGQS